MSFTKELKTDKPEIAKEDIVVFKYMKKDKDGNFMSKYTNMVYELNKVYSLRDTLFVRRNKDFRLNIKEFLYALLFNRFVGIRRNNMHIKYAFHAFTVRDVVIEVKCIIPKGSLYLKNNHWKEIVSNRIKVIGVTYDPK